MNRINSLEIAINHPFLRKGFQKLKKSDIDFLYNFINENMNLNTEEFEKTINRFFLDKQIKPKNWNIISELLSSSNTIFKNDGG
jgi:predicted nuclease of restriction endonuclease-like RecB superfamily